MISIKFQIYDTIVTIEDLVGLALVKNQHKKSDLLQVALRESAKNRADFIMCVFLKNRL